MRLGVLHYTPANRAYQNASQRFNVALTRLATGKRINRAADDPAGVVAVTPMKGELIKLNRRIDRIERENAFLGIKEGGLSVQADLLLDLKGFVVQAANSGGVTPAEREAFQTEVDSILEGLRQSQHIINNALGSSSEGVLGQLGDFARDGDLNLIDGDIEEADRVINEVIEGLATTRGTIGVLIKKNDTLLRVYLTERENLAGAVSIIEDADFAKEAAEAFRADLLSDISLLAIETERGRDEDALRLLEVTTENIEDVRELASEIAVANAD